MVASPRYCVYCKKNVSNWTNHKKGKKHLNLKRLMEDPIFNEEENKEEDIMIVLKEFGDCMDLLKKDIDKTKYELRSLKDVLLKEREKRKSLMEEIEELKEDRKKGKIWKIFNCY